MHVNTGMTRLGHSFAEVKHLTAKPESFNSLNVKYVMSHLSASEDYPNPCNHLQLKEFKDSLTHFPNLKASFANSSGIFLGNDYHFDMTRASLALYGGNPLLGAVLRSIFFF